MKIIFVVMYPYFARDHHRFGAEYMMERGHEVEIWHVANAGNSGLDYSAEYYKGENYHELTPEEYRAAANRNRKEAVFIVNGSGNPLITLAEENCRYLVMTGLGAVPKPHPVNANTPLSEEYSAIKRKIIDSISDPLGFAKRRIGRLKKGCKDRTMKRLLIKNPPEFIVTSTHLAAQRYLSPSELKCNIIYTHALDYDRYIEVNRKNPNKEEKHILYCDSGFYHMCQDSVVLKRDFGHDCEGEYYSQLGKLFSLLEEHYHIPVVIAAHPHVVYGDNAFGGRKLIFDKTCELARDAAVFITTTSTATNFAVLYDLPILKIASKRLKTVGYYGTDNAYDWIKYEAEELLGCGFVDLDDDNEMQSPWNRIRRIPTEKRLEFLKDYVIDSNVSDQTIAEVIEENLNKEWPKE